MGDLSVRIIEPVVTDNSARRSLAPKSPDVRHGLRSLPSLDLSSVSFLVVDHNAFMRDLIRRTLHILGARDVLEARDAVDAGHVLGSRTPDMMLTDFAMPDVSGLALVRNIRLGRIGSDRFLPIIMLSDDTREEVIHAARDAGVHEILAKPFSAKGLYSHITKTIIEPRPFIESKDYFGPCRRGTSDEEYLGPDRRQTEAQPITPPSKSY